MDVAIRLSRPIKQYGKTYVIYGKYVNQAFVETFELGVPVKLSISSDKIENWLVCRDPKETCIRNSKWTALAPSKVEL